MKNKSIEIDVTDYELILNHEGKIVGSSFSTTKSTINDDFKKEFGNYIADAQGIIVNFYINKELSLLAISEVMDYINNESMKDADIVFSTSTDDSFEKDEINVSAILSGL